MICKLKIKIKKGFTLFELLCVFAVFGILISLATHAYGQFVQRKQQETILNKLSLQIKYAKRLAYSQKREIVLLANDNDWARGWKIFEDTNQNQAIDIDEAIIEQIMAENQNNSNIVTIVDSTRACMMFDREGLIHRCSLNNNINNLIMSARIILSSKSTLSTQNWQKVCSDSSSMTIINHFTKAACHSKTYQQNDQDFNKNGFIGNCVCS